MIHDWIDVLEAEIKVRDVEIERLKKELEEVDNSLTENWYNKGLVEGERRAMERVKEAIGNPNPRTYAAISGIERVFAERKRILKELGLGEEEKK